MGGVTTYRLSHTTIIIRPQQDNVVMVLEYPSNASIPVLVQKGEISLMHIKSKWTRSFLFAASGLMLSIGILKIDEQTTGLIVIIMRRCCI